MTRSKTTAVFLCLMLSAALCGCGGGLIDGSIGGTVSGLSGGTNLVLQDNGGDTLTVSADGNFTFASKVQAGSTYAVTVETQPIGETCTITNGSGTVTQSSGDVTNVTIKCNANTTANNYLIGNVSGLATGKSVTLVDNNANPQVISANGIFVLNTALSAGTAYNVTVSVNPTGQTCTVTNGTGTFAANGSDTTLGVTCK